MRSCLRTTLINFFDALQMFTTVVIVLVIFVVIVLGVNGPLHMLCKSKQNICILYNLSD